jgi:hypothetical protein
MAGAVFADGGTTVIETSRFFRNAGTSDCGAVGVTGRARLHILSSVFEGNSGRYQKQIMLAHWVGYYCSRVSSDTCE